MYILYILIGFISGILGGMGMGGGTILIPILTIFFNVNQKIAQAINLISFIPMSIIALIIHIKNKLINYKHLCSIILSGIISSFFGAKLVNVLSTKILSKFFGGFLILLGIVNFFLYKAQNNDNSDKNFVHFAESKILLNNQKKIRNNHK